MLARHVYLMLAPLLLQLRILTPPLLSKALRDSSIICAVSSRLLKQRINLLTRLLLQLARPLPHILFGEFALPFSSAAFICSLLQNGVVPAGAAPCSKPRTRAR